MVLGAFASGRRCPSDQRLNIYRRGRGRVDRANRRGEDAAVNRSSTRCDIAGSVDRRCLDFDILVGRGKLEPARASAEGHRVSSGATTATNDGGVRSGYVSCVGHFRRSLPASPRDRRLSEVSRVFVVDACRGGPPFLGRGVVISGQVSGEPGTVPVDQRLATPCPLHGRKDGTDKRLPSVEPPVAARGTRAPGRASGELAGALGTLRSPAGWADESADATPCPLAIAAPIPSATANPPTRPTYMPQLVIHDPLVLIWQIICMTRGLLSTICQNMRCARVRRFTGEIMRTH